MKMMCLNIFYIHLLIATFIVVNVTIIISAFKINITEPCSEKYSLDLTRFRNKTLTIIISVDQSNDDNYTSYDDNFMKSCFIRNSGDRHSFGVFNEIDYSSNLWKSLRKLAIKEPNILIFTRFPTSKLLDNSLLRKTLLLSKWSLVIIIATTEKNEYSCAMDNRLFNEIDYFVNKLWQKFIIINLIISIPLVCPDHYIIYDETKYVDDNNLYHRTIALVNRQEKTLNLTSRTKPTELTRNYPLHANIFNRFPTSITDCEGIKNYVTFKGNFSKGYCGLDGLIMADIVEYFGFNISTKHRGQGATGYGYLDNYGHVTGSLGNVVRGEVDISFNSRFLALYGVSDFNFLHYISSDHLCAIVKKSDEVPIWLFPYDVYSLEMWSTLIIALLIVGLFLWISAKCSMQFNGNNKLKIRKFFMDSLITGLFGFSTIKSRFFILKSVCFFSSVIFTATFQGHVNYAYTTLVRYDQINNLQDLYDSGGLIITTTGILNLVEPPYNELHIALLNRIVLDDNSSYTDILIKNKNAALGRRSDMLLQTMKFYTDPKGNPLFHVVEECFRFFYLSFIASQGFPFKEEVKGLVGRLIEAGLPDRYYQWTRQSLGLSDTYRNMKDSSPRPTSPIELKDLRIAFGLLAMGYMTASIMFIVEKCGWNCMKREIAF